MNEQSNTEDMQTQKQQGNDMKYRLGVDTGGTFTDATLINQSTGDIHVSKVPSTPSDPSRGFLNAVSRILANSEIPAEEVAFLVHGTTVATNAIIEGNMAPVAFITTHGFRDMLEIARQIRPSLYDLQFQKPPALVPRQYCYGVMERLDDRGNIITPLDESEVEQLALKLRDTPIESIAICLLHAYVNDVHERAVENIIRKHLPDVFISRSSEVAPEFREYIRATTTIINAGVRPVVARYLQKIENQLNNHGLESELLLMQSSGGVYPFDAAKDKPVFMVESGPAAGVMAARYLGNMMSCDNLISFDMGGTTAKAGMIENGKVRISKEYEVGNQASSSEHGSKGQGYPIRTPVIDLVEIGAGGGSIAWVDTGGGLRVGPLSAGAEPGPVSYASGGQKPTITDANLILGRIDADYFLGGELRLDVKAARSAIRTECSSLLGLDVIETAYGILEIANAAMAGALRRVSVHRGYDPRDFALVAFGGAGPLHANRLASELGIQTIIVPVSPGTFSATGLLVTDLRHDYSNTLLESLDELQMDQVIDVFESLKQNGQKALMRERVQTDAMHFEYAMDMRYLGQSFDLNIPFTHEELSSDGMKKIMSERFHSAHLQEYGFHATNEPIMVVQAKLTAVGRLAKPSLAQSRLESQIDHRSNQTREVFFGESGGFVECPIYHRSHLETSRTFSGPAVIQELGATTLIHPGSHFHLDDYSNILITQES